MSLGRNGEVGEGVANERRRLSHLSSSGLLTDEPDFRLSEGYFEELTDAAHDAFVAFDRNGLVRTWNTAAARHFGYTAQEILGRPLTVLVPGAEAGRLQERIERVLEGERIRRVRADGARRDGTVVPMTLTVVPLTGRGGYLMARDLTEEHLAQTTLTEAEHRMREAQELSHVGLWLWDVATDGLQISDELYRIHGISPLEFDGTLAAYLTCIDPDDRLELEAAMTTALTSGRGLELEYRIVRPDGSTGWVFSRAEVVSLADGSPGGLRGVAQDVTDRKRAAESLRKQASLLELLRGIAVAANEATDLEQALRTCIRGGRISAPAG